MHTRHVDTPNACGCNCGNDHGRNHDHGESDGTEEDGCALTLPKDVGTPLNAEAYAAILEALDDEYKARAFYLAVLEHFPGALPFDHVVDAEERHADKLAALLRLYGHVAPTNAYIGSEEILRSAPASLACACDMSVEEKRRNVSLYKSRLLPQVSAYPRVIEVFTRLMLASRDRHLPAFEHWSKAYRANKSVS